jgi:predicted kinase
MIRVVSGRVVIEIPDPALVVLVGAAGAGKSTFAARHFAPEEVLSSDAHRAAISGDAADQRVTGSAFAALHRALARRLGAGRLTVIDATNVTASARRALLERAKRAGIPAVAIVLDLDPDLVLARNRARTGRIVPDDVVARQLAHLDQMLDADALAAEGVAAVFRLADAAAVDGVRIVRTGRNVPRGPPSPRCARSDPTPPRRTR